ncbi:PRA1 family protein 3-like [Amphiura filiformis]|uniref:PRA1 family protein 3-like n=1 Tax=Amphiura filiformis TaxID=82378 RepID=UPI003B21DD7E
MDDLEVPPLRTMNDFLLESARFAAPTFNNPVRWANRVIDNLLYYQTNYFLSAILVFLIVGCLNPLNMLVGIFTMVVLFGLFVFATNNKRETQKFKRDHPLLCFLALVVIGYLAMRVFGSVLVFIWGIMVPLTLIFLHASMRLRNLKNKMSKKLESLGLKRTPMGIILFELGLEEQARS